MRGDGTSAGVAFPQAVDSGYHWMITACAKLSPESMSGEGGGLPGARTGVYRRPAAVLGMVPDGVWEPGIAVIS